LDIHYESQCVPTPIAWYFHHMPGWFRRLSTSLTFYIEIYLPLAFLLPLSCLRKFVFCQQVPFTVIDKSVYDSIPDALTKFYYQIDPYQIVNPYGLFRTMTGLNGRPEVIVEGALDPDGPWKEFDFYSKPGN
ncbi:hypothetical protein TELCIR_17772, partial [Teladorsagia circumcincta]